MTQSEIEKAAEEYTSNICGRDYRCGTGGVDCFNADDVSKAFLAGAEHAGAKWVSVDERLPKLLDEVLVAGNAGKGPFVHIAELDTDDTDNTVWWNGDPYRWMPGMITHWMPLPAAPEAESK